MEKIMVTNQSQLDALYNSSALTVEGLDSSDESLNMYLDVLKKLSPIKNERFYIVTGAIMNKHYHLTGSNAYPDDTHLVCMMLEDISDISKIVYARFSWRGRWFDDICDNNRRRESEE